MLDPTLDGNYTTTEGERLGVVSLFICSRSKGLLLLPAGLTFGFRTRLFCPVHAIQLLCIHLDPRGSFHSEALNPAPWYSLPVVPSFTTGVHLTAYCGD